MSYFMGEKHTSEMNSDEIKEIEMMLEDMKQFIQMPPKTLSFIAGLRRWYKGHGKLVSKQVYWLKHWYSTFNKPFYRKTKKQLKAEGYFS